ncbi:MAG: arylsulfatase [Promethearchaeota archaeon]|nr:MAG: arylsulfatase [Candidatus Lokiarchaeota archaeon]
MEKPNIIFIFTDQQRYDTCGCYGQELNVTPNLDKMAEQGVLFKNAFTCQPVCGPARSCLQTGRYATETMCYRNGIALPLDSKTIAYYFSEAGYEVGYIGKWHLASTVMRSKENVGKKCNYTISPIPAERRGGYKDYWLAADLLEFTSHPYEGHLFDKEMKKVDFKGYRTDCLTDFVLKYLNNCNSSKPLFLFLSYLHPHQQNDQERIVGPQGSGERFKNYKVPGDLEGTDGDWKDFFPDYLGCCNSIDYNLKRIQDTLGSLNMLDNTILFYASDHGCHFRTRNTEYKRSCHEASIHIPLVIKGPGFEEGQQIDELVSLIDLPPTLLRCAGINIPSHMRGRPLQELIFGDTRNWPKEVFLQISESQVGRAIRTEKWKYSIRAPSKSGWLYAQSDLYMEDYLYDLEHDLHEKNNLASDPAYAQIRAELADILKKKMAEAGENIPRIIPKSSY